MKGSDRPNNTGCIKDEEYQPVIEAEVAPSDIREVVQEEVQRVVQEVLLQESSSSQRPLAIVVASERKKPKSETSQNQRERNDGKICGLPRATFFVLVVVVVVSVAIASGIAAGSSLADDDDEAPDSSVSTEAPAVSPSLTARTSMMDILYPSHYHQTVENLSAAQYSATLWILEEDTTFEWNTPNELLERHALATLYFGLDGKNWSEIPWLWLSNATHCEWEAVACDNDRSVISLDLSNRGLHGSMPAEIGRLSNLEELALSGNQITGQLPKELYYGLTKLHHMNIAGNLLTSIGADFGQLTNLRRLFGGQNLFTSIPSEIGNLQSLEVLNMVGGQLNSTLPAELGRVTSLLSLNLANNFLRGSVPFLSALSNLEDLTLSANAFSGQIPPVGEMTALTWMLLNDNHFAGSLPNGLDKKVPLEHFNAANNQIGSTIPPELFGLGRLTSLRLENNSLSGPLPTDNSLASLRSLRLNHNRITLLPSDLGTVTSLQILELAYNRLNTTLPTELGNLYLREFDVRGNQLYGNVPESFNRWSQIRFAYFYSNNFTGGLENLFCSNRYTTHIFEADCELVCNCCTDCQ